MLFRLKKLIGTVILLVFVPTYALFALALATVILPGTDNWTQLGYYALAGLAWVPPAGLIVYWMFKPAPTA
ncbi:MAG TPA: DUF2842 domain-containing protein [Methylomirabilota bacterium]|nr:DUF2842 domain-containing protein [Methylomirabilota bacterium]